MIPFDTKNIHNIIDEKRPLLLVADIGGTNSTFGVYQEQDGKQQLLTILHMQSKLITDFTHVVVHVVEYINNHFKSHIDKICIAGAGMVNAERDLIHLTNRSFVIDAKAIAEENKIAHVVLANDFEVVGYGIAAVAAKDLIVINEGHRRPYAHCAVIGAGTGLGKSILYWDLHKNRYETLASEGGHADCSVQNQLEFDLIKFIHEQEYRTCNISWEDLLSGYGIQRIYHFFKHRNNHLKSSKQLGENGPHPDEIFKSRHLDAHALATYQLYTTLYARCIKNFALDSLSLGGVYVTGGIAIHNIQMFKEPLFFNEFINCAKLQELLKTIPVTIVADYYVSLYGAAEYFQHTSKK